MSVRRSYAASRTWSGRCCFVGADAGSAGTYEQLASYRHCVERIREAWPGFSMRRRQRLQQGLFDAPVEKVAENIVEDLFTTVLDWPLTDVNLQVGHADVVLSSLGIKRLVLEVKRPGALVWRRRAMAGALEQARRYAGNQDVAAVAVSDGHMLYAADIIGGGLQDRALVTLDRPEPPEELWWVSVHGIYRPCPVAVVAQAALPEDEPLGTTSQAADGDALVHPKYHLTMSCFAFVADANDPHTWKLPYRLDDGTPDTKRLPKAIQSILSNYRGAKVGIPRDAVGDVLVRLGIAAAGLHKMPCQTTNAADAYVEAHHALEQLRRLNDVGCCTQLATETPNSGATPMA